MLQQYLPFTVLKLKIIEAIFIFKFSELQQYLPFTVLKHAICITKPFMVVIGVATVLTVYGIETGNQKSSLLFGTIRRLQQYLPFTVLKLPIISYQHLNISQLQQYLPFTVLKRFYFACTTCRCSIRCNSTYRLRYMMFG